MCRMIGSIRTLNQHFLTFESEPCAYRPERCDRCGRSGLWGHGVYYRRGDRSLVSDNHHVLIPIPRFICSLCGATCSRLPGCLSPRRWYPWSVQGLALLLVLNGTSYTRIRDWVVASEDTIRRWRAWLMERTRTFEFHLRSVFPQLGRHGQEEAFWAQALREKSLSRMMATVCRQGEAVP